MNSKPCSQTFRNTKAHTLWQRISVNSWDEIKINFNGVQKLFHNEISWISYIIEKKIFFFAYLHAWIIHVEGRRSAWASGTSELPVSQSVVSAWPPEELWASGRARSSTPCLLGMWAADTLPHHRWAAKRCSICSVHNPSCHRPNLPCLRSEAALWCH